MIDVESMSDEELTDLSLRAGEELARRADLAALPLQIEELSERLARSAKGRKLSMQAAERGAARGAPA